MNKETILVVTGSQSEFKYFLDKIAIKADNVDYRYIPNGYAHYMRGCIQGTKIIFFGNWYDRKDIVDIAIESKVQSFKPICISER